MSMRSGNRKKGKPKYQNTFAFRHNKNSKLTKQINNIPNVGLCSRCVDVIEWKKKYRKYKPLKAPRKCTSCQQRTVKYAYHVYCRKCAQSEEVCAKCLQKKQPQKSFDEAVDHSMTVEEVFELLGQYNMKERKRRALVRDMENGLLTCKELKDSLAKGVIPNISKSNVDEEDDDTDSEQQDAGIGVFGDSEQKSSADSAVPEDAQLEQKQCD